MFYVLSSYQKFDDTYTIHQTVLKSRFPLQLKGAKLFKLDNIYLQGNKNAQKFQASCCTQCIMGLSGLNSMLHCITCFRT